MHEQLAFDFFKTETKEADSSDRISFNISRWPDEYTLKLSMKEIESILIDTKAEIKTLNEFLKRIIHQCTKFRVEFEIKSVKEIIDLLEGISLNSLKNDYKMKYKHVTCLIDMYRRKESPHEFLESSINYDHEKRMRKCKRKQSKLEESIGEDAMTILATKSKEELVR